MERPCSCSVDLMRLVSVNCELHFGQDTIAYTSVIDAWASSGVSEQSLKIFDEMRQQGLQPNLLTYNVTHTMQYYFFVAAGQRHKHRISKAPGTAEALIKALAKRPDMSAAEEVLVEMRTQGVGYTVFAFGMFL